jgi:acyl dehydratase
MDEEAAKHSHFGALCASGWHTAAICMRLMVNYRRQLDEQARRRGEAVGIVGPALGFRELKWLKPVYVGDTIDYASEVVEKRPSGSRPGFGLMSIQSIGTNQKGETVISFAATTFVERRPERP